MTALFGYVGVNQKELKCKDYEHYQAYYCGLCRSLKKAHGALGQLTLSYDMTFLVLLLTALYEPDNQEWKSRCVLHPFAKRTCIANKYADYGADMNILLSYFKCLDDWEDEHKISKYGLSLLLKGKNKQVEGKYQQKAKVIFDNLKAIHQCEQKDVEKVPNVDTEIAQNREQTKKSEHAEVYTIDTAAGYFGNIMEELFVYRHDEWEHTLRHMGFYFGKFLYLMDAYEDMEKDSKTHNYNPILKVYYQMYPKNRGQVYYIEEFEQKIKGILRMMMAECAKAFEHLPIVEETDILRNILYSGVWCRYEMVRQKRLEETMKKNEKQSRQES